MNAWILAARPKTLAAALAPVMVGAAEAKRLGFFDLYPFFVCLAFALLIQIATNMANDYFDFRKGADTKERLGPERMVASGRIEPRKMLAVAIALFALAFAIGFALVFYRGWELLVIGLVSIAFGYAYTGGPYPLAYHGLGDVFVIVFFGLVATVGTFYVMTGFLAWPVATMGLSLGLLANNILVVNNCRDLETDAAAGKRTLAVRFGRSFSIKQYWLQLFVAHALLVAYVALSGNLWALIALASLLPACPAAVQLGKREGAALNPLLGSSAQALLVFAAAVTVAAALA